MGGSGPQYCLVICLQRALAEVLVVDPDSAIKMTIGSSAIEAGVQVLI